MYFYFTRFQNRLANGPHSKIIGRSTRLSEGVFSSGYAD